MKITFFLSSIVVTLIFSSVHASTNLSKSTNSLLNCDETSTVLSADNSPSKQYFIRLLKSGISAPLNDFLIFWYPERNTDTFSDADLEQCEIEGCNLDTFYSWGPLAKVKTFMKTMPDGKKWSGFPNPGHMFATLFSAVGSYGYGLIPVRIKLNGNKYPVHPDREQSISDGSEVESWSFASPEHYDEIIRDLIRYKTNKLWHGYTVFERIKNEKGFQNQLFFDLGIDGNEFSENVLKRNLLKMIQMILNREGRIYYSKNSCRNRDLAFKTKFPTYINPNKE